MTPNEKTKVLIEALPYIERYHNKTVVIKLGGNAMSEIRNATEDIAFLKRIGIKEIDKELKKLGIAPKFINGLRYTDEKIIKAVEKIFQRINKRIVGKLKSKGVKTISAVNCIDVRQKSKDLGLVGEITKIDKDKLLKHLASGYVPVISPIGIGKQNQRYK